MIGSPMDEFMRTDFGAPLPVADILLRLSERPFSWLRTRYEDFDHMFTYTPNRPDIDSDDEPLVDFSMYGEGASSVSKRWLFNPYRLCELAANLHDFRAMNGGDSGATIGEVAHLLSRFPHALKRAELFRQSVEAPAFFNGVNRDTITSKSRSMLRPLAGDAWLSYLILTNRLPLIHQYLDADGVIELAAGYIATGIDVSDLRPYINFAGCDTEAIRMAHERGLPLDILGAAARDIDWSIANGNR